MAPRGGSATVFFLSLFLLVLLSGSVSVEAAVVEGVRHSTSDRKTRVVLDMDKRAEFTHRPLSHPPRVVVELPACRFDPAVQAPSIGDGYVEKIRFNTLRSGKIQVVLDLGVQLDYSIFTLKNPDRIVVDVTHKGSPSPTPSPSAQEAKPSTSSPPSSATREPIEATPPPTDGWVVAIDAGHGGQDTGASYYGTHEKDVVLALAKQVQEQLDGRAGIRAFLVRKGDYFIPLRRRWTLAEKQGADLFVSLHCNASKSRKAEGTEVFFLSLKGASDEAARELAEFENSVDQKMGVDIPEDDLNDIIFDMMQTDVLAKSQILAEACLDHLFELGTVYSRGVKQAGFAVLKSPRMPSVLVEAAFLSSRDENKMVRDRKWQHEFGLRLADGIEAYVQSVDPSERVELR